MTIASTFEPGHILVQAAETFKEEIESESDGDISVEISPGGSYGSEDEIGEVVSQGGVEAHAAGSFPYFQFAPEYWFFGCPFVLSGYDQLLSVLESDEMQEAHDALVENGDQRPIGQQIYRGARNFTSNTPIRSPSDVDGTNLRLPELDPWVAIWEEVGASPTPVALDELYSALEQGTADASEGGAEQISSFNLYEVQSHLSLTEHLIANGNIYINDTFYQGIDETYQDMIMEVGQSATSSAAEQSQSREEELIQGLAEEGMEIVEDVDVEAFQEEAAPAVEQLFENTWAFDWETVQNM
ncbi:TRAP transporter substrate-binding protein [Natrinema versiforme]|uniref:TRAP transporter substrate-binding protein n=1 Tax=Natrinema versiforme TaxID=88724 RepID=A0A4P8WNY8_9EURY|nr:TRAP transporter substrate-binding protein [Natrinema versiforme]QCS45095.1 TRAP transporter substrate-binding protein [Natrinema versiforme]